VHCSSSFIDPDYQRKERWTICDTRRNAFHWYFYYRLPCCSKSIEATRGAPDPEFLDPAGSWSRMILALPYLLKIFYLLFLHHNLKHLDWLSVWLLVKSFRNSTSCRCWQFVYDNNYSTLCSSGVQKLLTDVVCHQQLNINIVAFSVLSC